MRLDGMRWPRCGAVMRWSATLTLVVSAICFVAPGAQAQEDDALKILKGMSAYLASQKTISLSYDSDIEVITPELQKIQFASSGQVLLSRPTSFTPPAPAATPMSRCSSMERPPRFSAGTSTPSLRLMPLEQLTSSSTP